MLYKCHLICLFVFHTLKLCVALNEYQKNIIEDNVLKITQIFGTVGSGPGKVDGHVLRTSSQFQCKVLVPVEDEHILMFGSKAWIFPEQDVNLTIKYPRNDYKDECHDCGTTGNYIITKMEVIIHDDGTDATSAYILSGGLLEESIAVSFISESATVMSYQFWLYGAVKESIEMELFKSKSWSC